MRPSSVAGQIKCQQMVRSDNAIDRKEGYMITSILCYDADTDLYLVVWHVAYTYEERYTWVKEDQFNQKVDKANLKTYKEFHESMGPHYAASKIPYPDSDEEPLMAKLNL